MTELTGPAGPATHDDGRVSTARRENQSVRKAAAILRAAADSGSGATVSALARAADLPRATALRMVAALVAENLLARRPDDRVVIGPGVYALVRAANLSDLLLDAARHPLDELASRIDESITLTAVLPDGSLSTIRQIDGPHLLGLTSWVGRAYPPHASSSGKLALAFADDARVRALLRRPLISVAPRTITDPGQLRMELAVIRARGWSQIEDEMEAGLAAVSVGIAVHGGLVATVNISGPSARFTAQRRAATIPLLLATCALIEHNLGAAGPDD